ncbi:MAG: type II toxin-antitoxin system ParD family antitoxin, partial [Thiolinea sp.]
MSKNTSIALSEHFQDLIKNQVQAGHYASASEVVRAAMHLFEEQTNRMERLRAELHKCEVGEGVAIED